MKEYATLLSLVSEVRSALKERGCAVDGDAWQEALDLDSLIRLIQKSQWEKAKTLLLSKLEVYRKDYKFRRRV